MLEIALFVLEMSIQKQQLANMYIQLTSEYGMSVIGTMLNTELTQVPISDTILHPILELIIITH